MPTNGVVWRTSSSTSSAETGILLPDPAFRGGWVGVTFKASLFAGRLVWRSGTCRSVGPS